MAEVQIYLTVSREKKNGKHLAVISLGSPQKGDKEVKILSHKVVDNMKEAKKWYKECLLTKPWETRQ